MTLKRLLATNPRDGVATLLRLALGVVMFPHGAQKVLGWFGGGGFGATYHTFTHDMGIPAIFAVLAILAEFAGSLGLLVGLLSRVAAFGIGMTMVVAVAMVHGGNGFFMNWSGTQAGEGFEYHILAIAIAVAVMVRGAGAKSLDALIAPAPCRPSQVPGSDQQETRMRNA